MYESLIGDIQSLFPDKERLGLHEPQFDHEDEASVVQCILSGFVSSIGSFVNELEERVSAFTKLPYCIATNSGTSALQLALRVYGVKENDLVITQSLSFAATSNAILYLGATPCYLDIDRHLLSLSFQALQDFLEMECIRKDGSVWHKSGRRVGACLLMHSLGIPAQSQKISELLAKWGLPLIEDAAEALGSFDKDHLHVGHYANMSAFSLNGNKIITSGGGGFLLCKDIEKAQLSKHLSTTAKLNHAYEFVHDQMGYNFRLPNLNAALACSQLNKLPRYLKSKQELHKKYTEIAKRHQVEMIESPMGSNCWLNAFRFPDLKSRDFFINQAIERNIQVRPLWKPSHLLPYISSPPTKLNETESAYEQVVCLPSSPANINDQ